MSPGLHFVDWRDFLTSTVHLVLIVWKGAASATAEVKTWGPGEYIGVIFGAAAGVALLSAYLFIPYLVRKLVHDDWQVRWYDMFKGPMLLKRGPVPPKPEGVEVVQDYYRGHRTKEQLQADGTSIVVPSNDIETNTPGADLKEAGDAITSDRRSSGERSSTNKEANETSPEEADKGKWYEPRNFFPLLKKAFFHGVDVDVVAEQKKSSILTGNLEEMHARATHYDNKAEHAYSFLQVLTAATASFAHGANDVSNAIGPLATIFLIWKSGQLSSKAPVPVWILCYGGAAIVIGLWTYGYNIMRNLGNRLTLHSPSRGFSMELGSAITVVMATRLALPVSTTQCIVGATVGVGLCTGDVKAINWRMVLWIYGGWIITLPVTGIISGCLMGIIINAPQWGSAL